jgi:hypothetical protein
MISTAARDGIDQIFIKAARSRIVKAEDDDFQIESLAPTDDVPAKATIIVLTISSFAFRLLTLLHIEETATTRDYFLGAGEDQPLAGVISEIGNMCCGAMNQDLLRYFPDLGMSTPYELSGRCMPFVDELKPGYLSRYGLTINGNVRLMATVCVCEYAPIDFAYEVSELADVGGELELF